MAKQLLALSLLFFVLTGCRTWKFYVAKDKQTRKDKQLDFRMGRSFSGDDAICVEVNLINWSSRRVKIPRSAVVMKSDGQPMRIVSPSDLAASRTFRNGVFNYYEQAGQRNSTVVWVKRLYAPATLVLRPRNTRQTKLICYTKKSKHKGPFTLHLEGVQLNGKSVRMKSFRLTQLKKKDDDD